MCCGCYASLLASQLSIIHGGIIWSGDEAMLEAGAIRWDVCQCTTQMRQVARLSPTNNLEWMNSDWNLKRAVNDIALLGINILYNSLFIHIFALISLCFQQSLNCISYRRLSWVSYSTLAAVQASAHHQALQGSTLQWLSHHRLLQHCSINQAFLPLEPLISKPTMDLRWAAIANPPLNLLCPPMPL